ncbi:hypothetical protein [Actinophytocola sp. KF-1]
MLADRVLGSTAQTFRLTFVLVVVATVLVALIKAVPWDHLDGLLPWDHR